jgi:hypothetical protein
VRRARAFLQHNLHEFQESIINPIIDIPTKAAQKIDLALIDQRTAMGIEAARWARLGSELDFFPVTETEELVRKQWVFMTHNLDAFIRRWSQHFDPGLAIADLPYLRELSAAFSDPCCLHPVFQELLAKTSLFNADAVARSLSAAINFTSDQEWAELMSQDIEAPKRASATPTVSVEGVARTLDFVNSILRIPDVTLTNREVDEADAYSFMRNVGSIVRWRMSAHLPRTYERFEVVISRIFGTTEKQLGNPRLPEGAKDLSLKRLRKILDEWRSMTKMHAA